MAGELFKIRAGISMTHVPYRGMSAALSDLLGGQLQVFFPSVAMAVEYTMTERMRALAVTSAKRSPALPEVPAMAELVP